MEQQRTVKEKEGMKRIGKISVEKKLEVVKRVLLPWIVMHARSIIARYLTQRIENNKPSNVMLPLERRSFG